MLAACFRVLRRLDLINCTLGGTIPRLDVRSQLYHKPKENTQNIQKERDNPEVWVYEAALFIDTKLSILFEC